MYYTTNVYDKQSNLIAIEYRPSIDLAADNWTPEQLNTALRVARFNAEILARHYGSCVAETGYGYIVQTAPLPTCTC